MSRLLGLTTAICCDSSEQYERALNTIDSLLDCNVVIDVYTGEKTTKELQELVRENITGYESMKITFCSIPGDHMKRVNTAMNECTTEYITFIDPGVTVAEFNLDFIRDDKQLDVYTGLLGDCDIAELTYYNQILPLNLNGLILRISDRVYKSQEELILDYAYDIINKTADYDISWGKHKIEFKIEDDRLVQPWDEELIIQNCINAWSDINEELKNQDLQNYIWNRITTAAANVVMQDSDRLEEFRQYIYPAYKYKLLKL